MKISYAITVCNEIEEIKKLVSFLIANKRDVDEIVDNAKQEKEKEKEKVSIVKKLLGKVKAILKKIPLIRILFKK